MDWERGCREEGGVGAKKEGERWGWDAGFQMPDTGCQMPVVGKADGGTGRWPFVRN